METQPNKQKPTVIKNSNKNRKNKTKGEQK
jgi:hypothetical protein